MNQNESAESLPEIENVSPLLQDTNMLELDQQIDTSAYINELEEEDETEISLYKTYKNNF